MPGATILDSTRLSYRRQRGSRSLPSSPTRRSSDLVEENLLTGAYIRRNGSSTRKDFDLVYYYFLRLIERHGFKTNYIDRKSTRLNSSHTVTSYAVFCMKKKTYGIDIHYERVECSQP